jgi:hypothetical protein
MKLNHLDLQVADVRRAVELFEELLVFRLSPCPTSSKTAVAFSSTAAQRTACCSK